MKGRGRDTTEEHNMIDYTLSIIARQEYEERVRSLTSVQDYEEWLRDDRQLAIWPIRSGIASVRQREPGWALKRTGRLLSNLGSALVALGTRLDDKTRALDDTALQSQLE
jgi:hypothetical protein